MVSLCLLCYPLHGDGNSIGTSGQRPGEAMNDCPISRDTTQDLVPAAHAVVTMQINPCRLPLKSGVPGARDTRRYPENGS